MLFRFPRLVHLMKADWEESKHPRADDGRFGSGSGGSTSSKKPKPSKTKRKMERRAEAAGQATLGGKAIQTLLGGGSALDKIEWLKASEKQPEPTKKPEAKPEPEEAEPSILDIINQRAAQAAAMRGKVPTLEHPSQREGGPEGGHSPRVPTQRERDYRDSQRQWDNDRRRMGIPVPGDELATLEIPGKPKAEKKPKAKPSPETAMASLDDINSLVSRTISERGPLASFHEEANYINYVLGAKTAQARNDWKRAIDEQMRAKSKYGAKHKTYRGMENDPVYAEVKAQAMNLENEYKKLQQKQKEVDSAFAEHGIKLHTSNPYEYGDVNVT